MERRVAKGFQAKWALTVVSKGKAAVVSLRVWCVHYLQLRAVPGQDPMRDQYSGPFSRVSSVMVIQFGTYHAAVKCVVCVSLQKIGCSGSAPRMSRQPRNLGGCESCESATIRHCMIRTPCSRLPISVARVARRQFATDMLDKNFS